MTYQRSTTSLRNDALRAIVDHCRMTPQEASSLRVDSYRRTRKGRQPYVELRTAEGLRAVSWLPAPVVRRLERYLARRARCGGVQPPTHAPLFATDCCTTIPRALTPLEIAELVTPRTRRVA